MTSDARSQPITPDDWREALAEFVHAYLLNNEPQVHPRHLAVAIWDWLQSQSPPYEAAIAALEQAQSDAERREDDLIVMALDRDSGGRLFPTVRLLGDPDAVRAVIQLKERAEQAERRIAELETALDKALRAYETDNA